MICRKDYTQQRKERKAVAADKIQTVLVSAGRRKFFAVWARFIEAARVEDLVCVAVSLLLLCSALCIDDACCNRSRCLAALP